MNADIFIAKRVAQKWLVVPDCDAEALFIAPSKLINGPESIVVNRSDSLISYTFFRAAGEHNMLAIGFILNGQAICSPAALFRFFGQAVDYLMSQNDWLGCDGEGGLRFSDRPDALVIPFTHSFHNWMDQRLQTLVPLLMPLPPSDFNIPSGSVRKMHYPCGNSEIARIESSIPQSGTTVITHQFTPLHTVSDFRSTPGGAAEEHSFQHPESRQPSERRARAEQIEREWRSNAGRRQQHKENRKKFGKGCLSAICIITIVLILITVAFSFEP